MWTKNRDRTIADYMTPRLFDVHTHTQFAAFHDDRDTVIRRALDAGVWMINVGTQRDTSKSAIETAHRYSEGVYATVGLHPIHTEKSYHDEQELGTFPYSQEYENVGEEKGFTSRAEEFDYEYYKNLAEDSKVVGIGECGLDYYRLSEETKEKQKDVFLKQIELAADVKKPLMVHCRNAFSDLISILQPTTSNLLPNPGVIHFFTGTVDDARKLLDLGFSFSFGGVITFARPVRGKSPEATAAPSARASNGASDYEEVIKFIPLDRILLETDAPYVTPAPYRGKRNEPAYISEVARKMAEIKKVSLNNVSETTVKNTFSLFGLAIARE